HQVLTSQQYGVATVWLVSTIGTRTTNRKISRRAIQEVDVQKACETILQPGAPIALRLQGSLLYGVSRVFSQQCSYVLTDAERIQAHMRAFYNSLDIGTNTTNPLAGRSKRNQLVLPDDPNFDLNTRLPAFHFDEDGNIILPEESQASRKTSSQMSPFSRDSLNSPGIGGSFLDGFGLPASHSSQMHSLLDPPGTIEKYRHDDQIMPVEEDNSMAVDHWGVEFDAEGNAMPVFDEPDLPQLPPPAGAGQAASVVVHEGGRHPFSDDQDNMMMNMDEPILPEADAFAPRPQDQRQVEEEEDSIEVEMSSDQVAMPAQRQRQRRRALLAPDRETKISRIEMRSWSNDYLEITARERERKNRRVVTVSDAKNNAYKLIFGRGLGDSGFPIGILGLSSPLADLFTGNKLRALLLGKDVEEVTEAPRGRRRSAFEALELEEDDNERRVRPRLENDSSHLGQGQIIDDELLPLLNEEVEVGREAGLLPDDNIPSDVPWNRPSSQIPSSSVKGGRHAQGSGRRVSASPLHGRGSQLHDIERFSGQLHFGSDDFGSAQSGAHTFSDPLEEGFLSQVEARTSQVMRDALDREGSNFLNFMERVAEEKGEMREDDGDRQWVKFDELFERSDQKRVVVAQAFYHVLSLATKNVIKVKQEGQNSRPFGTIHIGIE
ncbi:Rec8 like protein-domain-containing protein, partial [Lasiosphaeris hirsuta]